MNCSLPQSFWSEDYQDFHPTVGVKSSTGLQSSTRADSLSLPLTHHIWPSSGSLISQRCQSQEQNRQGAQAHSSRKVCRELWERVEATWEEPLGLSLCPSMDSILVTVYRLLGRAGCSRVALSSSSS